MRILRHEFVPIYSDIKKRNAPVRQQTPIYITYKDQRRKEREEKVKKKKLLQRKEDKSKAAIKGV